MGSQPVPCSRVYCRRTGLPVRLGEHGRVHGAVVGVVAAVGAGPDHPDAIHLVHRQPSVRAMPSRTKCGFCDPLQQVTWPSLISTTAQAGPMQACDWNGHSYSASITRAAVRNASSTLPTGLHVLALAHRRLADVVVELGLDSGTAARALDHSILSFWWALTASHSLSATTARKLFSRTTRAPGMSLIELSSTLTTESRPRPAGGSCGHAACRRP